MENVPSQILNAAKDIISSLGGIDNISQITAGKNSLLTISVHHLEYITTKKLKLSPCIKEYLMTDSHITLRIQGVPLHELEMAIRLYDEERRGLEEVAEEEKSTLERLFSFLQAAFTPLLSVILAGGFLQVLLIILVTFDIIPLETTDMTIVSTISGGVYHLLPILVAWSLARHYHTNAFIAATVTGLLVHPEVAAFISGPILGDFFGIGALSRTYSYSILPIFLIIPVQAKVDRYLSAQTNDMFSFFVKPFLLLANGIILGILLLGPVMTLVGNATLAGIQMLNVVIPWSVSALMATFGPLFVLLGAHYPILPLVRDRIAENGYEMILGPGFLVMNMAHAGVAFAVMLKTRKKAFRAYAGTSAVLALLGVSQPALYGLEVPLRRPFFHAVIGGAVGGVYAGIMRVKAFAMLNPSIIMMPFFRDSTDAMNLIHAGIAIALSFTISFVLTWRTVLYEPTDLEIKEAATSAGREGSSYL